MKERSDVLRLFSGEKPASSNPRHFTALKKRGHPILYLPGARRMAEATLRLYSAQSLLARTLIILIRGFIRIGIPFSREGMDIPIDENAPFPEFLKKMMPESKTMPHFGILVNPFKGSGWSYVLLLFDAAGQPAIVVKVGTSEPARRLIRVEQELFFPEKPLFPCLPEALDWYEGEEASAIAYRYVEGVPPQPRQHGKIGSLLTSWIWDDEAVPLVELPVWTKLETLLRESSGLESVFLILQASPIKAVFSHGDFAPWNMRVSSSRADCAWVVLDWELGSRRGIPGWDWIHFILQYNTLVRRLSPQATLAEIEALWASPDFQAYACRTGIAGIDKELTFIFLLYFFRYGKPRENVIVIRALLQEFKKKYFPGIVLRIPPPKISVVTPSYNQLPWLKLCVASVEDQPGVTVEQIIQDAQSGPELDTWVRHHSKAHLYVEADFGMYDAINRGFARATGDIVCWLNSDEQYLEGALSKVAHYFQSHPEVDVLFGDALLIGNTGTLLSYRRAILPNQTHIQLSHLNILSCATFVRRSVLERNHFLDTRWKAIADAVWVVNLLKAGIPMAVLHEPLAAFTITDKNLGQTSLALTEIEHWKQEMSLKMRWLRPFFVWRHRLSKLCHGAYWPRKLDVDLYTLSNPDRRTRRSASFLGFKWHHSS